MWIKSKKMINYLSSCGLEPTYNGFGEAYYIRSQLLDDLLFKYMIRFDCIPNRLEKKV